MKSQNQIHVFATWKVKEGQIETVLNLLKTVQAESIKEPGNLFYKVHQSTSDENTIILFEGYDDEAAIATHRNTANFQDIVLGQIVPLLENREVTLSRPIEF